MNQFDYEVIIVGGGVIGCAVARELSRYDLKICLLEKGEDVCSGTSKANSGIVHSGYDARSGTLKAELNVRGNQMMDELSERLDFEFMRNGSFVLCFHEKDIPLLHSLLERGICNKVQGLRIVSGEEVRAMEPNLTEQVVCALYAPSGGIVCPFGMTIALAENACDNGVVFQLNTEVKEIQKIENGFRLFTSYGEIRSQYIVNAAGVYADVLHNMISNHKIKITPRKGNYCLLDKDAKDHVTSTIFQLPGEYGKGILVTKTVHGNLLIGPTAVDILEKEDTSTGAVELEEIIRKSAFGVKDIPYSKIITSFAGLRAHEENGDFIIGEVSDADGFFDAAGIESPGLSCAPAIGIYLAELIAEKANAKKKDNFIETRKGLLRIDTMSKEDHEKLIKEKPEYGEIVCRCENVSKGEIVDAINRTLGATSLDGIKRRTRQSMGRCQGGFCTPKTMEILAGERNMKMVDICKNQSGSEMLTKRGRGNNL